MMHLSRASRQRGGATASTRILTRSALKNTTGYIGCSGRDCQAVTSAITALVTELRADLGAVLLGKEPLEAS